MRFVIAVSALGLASLACNASTGDGPGSFVGTGGSAGTGGRAGTGGGAGSGGAGGLIVPDTDGGGDPDADPIVRTLPQGFTQTEIGGYQLGPSLVGGGADAGSGTGNESCGNVLLGVVRDLLRIGPGDGGGSRSGRAGP